MPNENTSIRGNVLNRILPVVLSAMMIVAMMPAWVSAAESQTWITWGTPAATWTGNDEDGADLYTADDAVGFNEAGQVVITYSVNGGQKYAHAHLQTTEGGTVEGASVDEPDNTERTATISGLAPETSYRLFWDDSESNNKLTNDVYLTFTTEPAGQDDPQPSQTWITWGTPTATFTGKGADGSDLYTADSVVDFDGSDIVITYSVDGGRRYGHPHIQDAGGNAVEGASVSEADDTARVATISGLSSETTYRLFWAASESNEKLEYDVYLTFTTGKSGQPSQTWITWGSPDATWKGSAEDGADLYTANDIVEFYEEGQVVITYSVNGGQKYAHAHLQTAEGGTVEGASIDEPDNTERTAAISGLSSKTTYRLFWDASESNGKLTNDVYLTFTTGSTGQDDPEPSQTWITWGTPTATFTGKGEDGSDLYTADSVVGFEGADIVITYSVSGGRKYGHAHIQDAGGNAVEGASVSEADDTERAATITGLSPDTTYRLFWAASEANGHLTYDVYLTFTTGASSADEFLVSGIEAKYAYTGSEIKPEPVVKAGDKELVKGQDYDLSYVSSKGDDFTSANVEVTLTITGKNEYEGQTAEKTYKITKASIRTEDVSLPEGAGVKDDGTVEYAYTGSEIKPAPVIRVNGRELVRETDYVVTYSDDADFINAEDGKVLTVTVSTPANSNYKCDGDMTLKYTIVPKKVTPKVTLSTTSYTFNGKARKPSVTVEDGSRQLEADKDYTVSYASGRKNVGKYTVTVTLKGNYEGSKKASFKINPKNTKSLKLKAAKKSLKVSWTKQSAKMGSSRITGYQIRYSLKKGCKSGNKTVTVKGYKSTSKTIKKLKSGKRYYVQIRTYKTVKGVKYYSKWSTVKSVKVK